MSNMRELMEKAGFPFAGQAVGQKPGDQVRGSEPMPRKGGHKKHPYAGRLVGGDESTESVEEDVETELREAYQQYVAEWGAPGTAVGPGNDDADPVEIAAQRMQQTGGKEQAKSQIDGLVAQMQGARAQLADMNQQFPQGANPVEKAMAMQQMSAQKIDVKKQIEDLSKQIAALRPQAL